MFPVSCRVSHWSHCASYCTLRPRPPTRPRPLTCATSRCLIQPLLKVVSLKAEVTRGLAHPSSKADSQHTLCLDSLSPAGTQPPWAALKVTLTQSKWASREVRTGTASGARPDLVCQISMTWKRRLCDLDHPNSSHTHFSLCCSLCKSTPAIYTHTLTDTNTKPSVVNTACKQAKSLFMS